LSRVQSASIILDETDFYRLAELDACMERHVAGGPSINSYGAVEIVENIFDMDCIFGLKSCNILVGFLVLLSLKIWHSSG
jgi:hypothetical protein